MQQNDQEPHPWPRAPWPDFPQQPLRNGAVEGAKTRTAGLPSPAVRAVFRRRPKLTGTWGDWRGPKSPWRCIGVRWGPMGSGGSWWRSRSGSRRI